VALALAQRHGLRVYSLDQNERARFARVTRARQPNLYAFDQMSMDERWVLRSPATMAAHTITNGAEGFSLIVEDVLALLAASNVPPVLVEGPWLFPDSVTPVLSSPRQAIWLLPTEAFKRASAARRDKPSVRHETSDPARATHNWLARDRLIAAHVQREVEQHRLPWLAVDGTRPLEEMTALVAAHFAPLLPPATGHAC
jgi:hypothetical protein